MSSSVGRWAAERRSSSFSQAFNHDDGDVYHRPQHNILISLASSLPFICHAFMHNISPCSLALCAHNPNYSSLSNPIQQNQGCSLALSHPPPKASAFGGGGYPWAVRGILDHVKPVPVFVRCSAINSKLVVLGSQVGDMGMHKGTALVFELSHTFGAHKGDFLSVQ